MSKPSVWSEKRRDAEGREYWATYNVRGFQVARAGERDESIGELAVETHDHKGNLIGVSRCRLNEDGTDFVEHFRDTGALVGRTRVQGDTCLHEDASAKPQVLGQTQWRHSFWREPYLVHQVNDALPPIFYAGTWKLIPRPSSVARAIKIAAIILLATMLLYASKYGSLTAFQTTPQTESKPMVLPLPQPIALDSKGGNAVPSRDVTEFKVQEAPKRLPISGEKAYAPDTSATRANVSPSAKAAVFMEQKKDVHRDSYTDRDRIAPQIDLTVEEKPPGLEVNTHDNRRRDLPAFTPANVNGINYERLFEQDDGHNKKIERALAK